MWGIPEKSFQKAVLTVLTQISALSQFANNGNWIQAQYYAKRPQTFKYIEFHLLGYLRAYTGVCQRERIGPKYGGLAALPALACQKLSLHGLVTKDHRSPQKKLWHSSAQFYYHHI